MTSTATVVYVCTLTPKASMEFEEVTTSRFWGLCIAVLGPLGTEPAATDISFEIAALQKAAALKNWIQYLEARGT